MAMTADPLTESTVNNLLLEDDAFDFDNDFLADNQPSTILQETRDDKVTLSPRAALKRRADDGELGLDKEVKITKKRQPIAKLDEARLLSEPGIPKLRTLIRTKQVSKKLRLKGKGHEFSDAARLLNHFQLWLDNLYPRAKFADALQLVEKAGHSKRMHIMRKEWIDEGKPGYQPRSIHNNDQDGDVQIADEPDLFGENPNPSAQGSTTDRTSNNANGTAKSLFGSGFGENEDNEDTLFIPDANKPSELESERRGDNDNDPDDDELEALLAAAESDERTNINTNVTSTTRSAPRTTEESEGEDDDDDLDALLAMQDARTRTNAPLASSSIPARHSPSTSTAQPVLRTTHSEDENENGNADNNNNNDDEEEDGDGDDDLDVLLAEQQSALPQRPTQVTDEPTGDTPTNSSTNIPEREDQERQDDDDGQSQNRRGSGGKEGREGKGAEYEEEREGEDEDFDFLSD